MKNDLTGPLPLGELESLALPYESYQLALTSGQVSALVAETQTLSGTALDPAVLTGEGAYLLRNGDYWAPSGRVIFDAQHFFLPIEAIDAFGNQAFVEWDEFSLLVKKTRDALGNATVATNDYRVLAPKQIQDPNLNRVQVAFDALGMVVATAVLGKEGSTDGDTLEDPTTRIEYDLLAFQEERGPAFVHSLAREKHGTENPRWQETYTYSDGFGRVVQTKVQAEPGEVPGITGPVSERWVGTGRTVFNNKGNPVKQYEPFFSATHEFEDETEIVESGVTPILRYDSLDRLVQTDLPDGTFTKVVFDSWRQEEWDQNDTVLESAWYVRWNSPDPDGAPPTEPHERAAWLSAQHAETPTVTHLDTLGRPFLSVAHNKTGTGTNRVETFYRTRTHLDIEGNTLAIYDARQRSTSAENDSMNGSGVYANIRQTFDVLGRQLKVVSSDAGVRLSVQDVANKPLRSWDSRGHVMRGRYDALQRPTHSFVSKGTTETLVQRMVYGEALDPSGPSENPASPSPAQLRNLRGQVHLVYDGAGVVKAEEHDFKGNLLRARRRLTKGYEETPDWSVLAELTSPSAIEDAAEPLLETEVFETETEHDALNRVTLSKTPDGSETRPGYNEANLLEQMRVKVRGGSERIVVGNLDYNARGQRVLCEQANPTTGTTSHSIEYTYDEKTFRLTRLVTTRTSDGVTLQDLRYFFDAVGNITEVQDRAEAQEASRGIIFSGVDPVSGDGKYEYDALYRLTKAEGREHPGQQPADGEPTLGSVPHANDLSALERYTEEFAYDEVGNIQSVAHSAASTNWTRRYSYAEDSNRLLATSLPGDLPNQLSATYAHNEHGSMMSMPHLQEMDWDYAERLQHTLKSSGSGQHTYFTYDASGERVRKVYEHNGIVEERIYLGGFEIYRKWEAVVGGTLKLERETLHTMDDQRRVAMVETKTWDTIAITNPAELWRFQLGNHLDSASLELDESAGVLTYEEYHPYGSTAFHTAKSGAEVSTKRYRYTGKERDEETGLYYHGARYYAAWLGRWTAADPAGLVDGLNLYRYSRDNPSNFSDPGGTESKNNRDELGEFVVTGETGSTVTSVSVADVAALSREQAEAYWNWAYEGTVAFPLEEYEVFRHQAEKGEVPEGSVLGTADSAGVDAVSISDVEINKKYGGEEVLEKVGEVAKGVEVDRILPQQYRLETPRGATITGVRDTLGGRTKGNPPKPVGAPVVRVDKPHGSTNYPHVNIVSLGKSDPHHKISSRTLGVLGRAARSVEALGRIARPVALAVDSARLGDAIVKDEGFGANTKRTAASVAGGWVGALGGAWGGAKAGAVIGGAIGSALPGLGNVAGAAVGGLLGGILGAVLGGILGGSVTEHWLE